jgi:hypothetical protein
MIQTALSGSEELKKFYQSKFYFSYSSINKLLYSPRLFFSHYILKEKEDSVDAHLVMGKAVHCLLLEPEKFDDNFILIPGKIPTDSNRVIIDHIFNAHYLPMKNDSLCLEDFPTEILGQLLVSNLYQSLKTDAQRLDKILIDNNKEYFEFLKLKENKTVIDYSSKQQAEETVEVLRSDNRVRALLQLDNAHTLDVKNELLLTADLEKHNFGLKGIVDNVVFDHNSKTVFINDLKMTGKLIQDFPNSVDYYRYDIQAIVYLGLILNNFIFHRADAEDWKVVFTFVVVDKYNQIYPYQVSDETLKVWEGRFNSVLKTLDYHYNNQDYTLPYDLALGNVKL